MDVFAAIHVLTTPRAQWQRPLQSLAHGCLMRVMLKPCLCCWSVVCVLGRGCCGSRVSAVLAVLVLAPFYPSLAEFCKRGADWPSMRKAFECHKCLHNLPLVLYNCKYIIGNQMLINNDIGAQRNA